MTMFRPRRGRSEQAAGKGHEFRQIHRPLQGLHPVRPVARVARGACSSSRPSTCSRSCSTIPKGSPQASLTVRAAIRTQPCPPSRRHWPNAPKSRAVAPARSISIPRWRGSSMWPRRRARKPEIVSSPSSGCCLRSRWRKDRNRRKSSPTPALRPRRTSTPPSSLCARAVPPTVLRRKTPTTR